MPRDKVKLMLWWNVHYDAACRGFSRINLDTESGGFRRNDDPPGRLQKGPRLFLYNFSIDWLQLE